MPPRMKETFKTKVTESVKQQFGVKNPMALPRLEKIIVNVGMGSSLEGTKINPAMREQVLADLTVITGQKPVIKRARKSVSNFKLRAGFEVGAMVTLRGDRMWEFFDRLVSLAIPRIKDFRGLNPKSFDDSGNYAFGVQEQGIFPEVDMANANVTHGMNIQFVFNRSSAEMSRFVLGEMGVPFAKPQEKKTA